MLFKSKYTYILSVPHGLFRNILYGPRYWLHHSPPFEIRSGRLCNFGFLQNLSSFSLSLSRHPVSPHSKRLSQLVHLSRWNSHANVRAGVCIYAISFCLLFSSATAIAIMLDERRKNEKKVSFLSDFSFCVHCEFSQV